jgi:MoaA/NifB/PqqE/SkfB family radical SAM enzyme
MVSDLIRKGLFFYYTLKPFRFSLVKHQAAGRLKSLFGGGSGLRIVDLAVCYECNLSCAHCSAEYLKNGKKPLDLKDYSRIVAQAEEFDNLSFNITGGEPLLYKHLHELIPLLKPEKHYISIQTNGMLLTAERAKTLAGLGVNCITTSLDSPYRVKHNRFRGSSKSYDAVISAVKNARKAGMQALVGTTVTHCNIRTRDLKETIRLVNGLGAICLFNLAVPCGNWTGRSDVVLTGSDRKFLLELMDEFPATSTDHEPGRNARGCPAAMEKIYITPCGDVLPCPFIHLSFGNVKDETLKDILEAMRKNPYLTGYPKICVAAEDARFHREVMPCLAEKGKETLPVHYRDVFHG